MAGIVNACDTVSSELFAPELVSMHDTAVHTEKFTISKFATTGVWPIDVRPTLSIESTRAYEMHKAFDSVELVWLKRIHAKTTTYSHS